MLLVSLGTNAVPVPGGGPAGSGPTITPVPSPSPGQQLNGQDTQLSVTQGHSSGSPALLRANSVGQRVEDGSTRLGTSNGPPEGSHTPPKRFWRSKKGRMVGGTIGVAAGLGLSGYAIYRFGKALVDDCQEMTNERARQDCLN